MAKVTIGCTIPGGLVLQPQDFPAYPDPIIANGFKATPFSASYGGIRQGWGLTDLDADFWSAWLARNAQTDPVVRGAIFQVFPA